MAYCLLNLHEQSMYKLLLTFLFFGSFTLYGQTKDNSALKFTEYESAKYPGGSVEFSKFIDLYFVYSRRCIDDEIDGSVFLLFIVETDGTVSEIQTLKETADCPEFTKEAIRVLSLTHWIPGKKEGKVARTYYKIPIVISISE